MSQYYQQPDNDQYPQFDFPSPENQQQLEGFAPAQERYFSPENTQAAGNLPPVQEGQKPSESFPSAQEGQNLSGSSSTQEGYFISQNQLPIASFAPRQGGYSSLVNRRSKGSEPKQKKYLLLRKQETAGSMELIQGGQQQSDKLKTTGSVELIQGEQVVLDRQESTGSFVPSQEGQELSGKQELAKILGPVQEGQSFLGTQQATESFVSVPGGQAPSGGQESTGSVVSVQEGRSLFGRQQATGSFISIQGGQSFFGKQQTTGSFIPVQGGQSLLGNRQATGSFIPAQGGQLRLGNRQAAGSSVLRPEEYSPLGKRQAPPGSVPASDFQQFLKKLRAKRNFEQVPVVITGPRPFDVTVVAIVAASIGGLNLFLCLISLCSLSVLSSVVQPLYSTPYGSGIASQVSAIVGLNTLILAIFYYTALGIGHLFIAREFWRCKSRAYWSILAIEGLTICVQLIVLVINHNGSAFFANVYIPILFTGYLLASGDIRRTFQIPF